MAITLSIEGMTCGHCVRSLTAALQAVPGVRTASVSLDSAQACVDGTVDADVLVRAVEQEGYAAKVMETQ